MVRFSNVLLLDSGDDETHFNYYELLSSSGKVRLLFQVLKKHRNHKERDYQGPPLICSCNITFLGILIRQ